MTYHIHCVNCQNSILDKSNRPIIDNVFTVIKVLQPNQADHIQKICSLFERYCRQSKQIYHRQMFHIRTGLQTNQTDLAQTMCSLLERYCRQIKQNYHRYCVNYLSGIVDKPNRPSIDNMLSIRMALQTNQTNLSQTLC